VPCADGCPHGWKCQDGFCAPPEFSASCSSAGAHDSAAMSGMGGELLIAAGRANDGGQANAGGGQANAGGEPNTLGQGGGGSILEISTPPTEPACVGRDTVIPLELRGGVGPYSLRFESDDCGFSEITGAGPRWKLVAHPSNAGECQAHLIAQDSQGHSESRTISLQVRGAPRLSTEQLAPACPGEEYSAVLTAEGGNPDRYSYRVGLPEGSSWELVGATLAGNVDFESNQQISAWVVDDFCESEHVPLALSLESKSSGRCPAIDLEDDAESLPRPCAGMSYRTVFAMTAVASWEALELPFGLHVEQDTASPPKLVLSGRADSPSGEEQTLRIRLTSADNRHIISQYSLVPRDKCWLGYVSNQNGPWQFQLADSELRVMRSFPGNGQGTVTDFAFSPNGEFVAFDKQVDGAPPALALVNLRNLHEQALQVAGRVLDYSWAPDSRILVLHWQDDAEEEFLTAVDVSAIRGVSGGDLSPTSYHEPNAYSGSGSFTWFGSRKLGYLVPGLIPSLVSVAYMDFGQVTAEPFSFDSLQYRLPLELSGFSHGLLASNEQQLDYVLAESAEGIVSPHRSSTAAFAASGRFVARVVANSTLQLLEAASATPFARSADGQCGAVLAWASNPERVACVNDVEGGGEVRLFATDRLPATDPSEVPIVGSTLVRGDYQSGYLERDAEQRRRVFSPRGRYFASRGHRQRLSSIFPMGRGRCFNGRTHRLGVLGGRAVSDPAPK
jgi:hypothetical protein